MDETTFISQGNKKKNWLKSKMYCLWRKKTYKKTPKWGRAKPDTQKQFDRKRSVL